MAELTRPKALIFDLDGTLLDTEPLYTQAADAVLKPFGKVFSADLKRRTMGGDSRVSAAVVIDHFNLPMTVEEYLGQRESFLRELFGASAEIRGAGRFVESMAAGLHLGVATSSIAELTALKLSHRDWSGCFTVTVCGDDPRLHNPKPEPDIFLLCADDMGVSPRDCIVFEDSPNGIAAAVKAGMRVVAIDSPYVELTDLHQADLVVSDFLEAIKLFTDDWLS